jgi:serralysin
MAAENETHFCMMITPESLPAQEQAALEGRKAALLKEFRWPTGSIIKVKFLEGDPALQAKVRDVAKRWTGSGMANLTLSFVPADQNADIRIAFEQGAGSWSYIGTVCRTIAKTQPTMNFGWLTPSSSDEDIRSVVLHEFGHALGLIHEHQNPNKAIQWNKPAVRKDLSQPPNNWDDATIQRNLFDKYDPKQVEATEVDPKSIMMYPIPKSWTLDGFSAGFNSDLSAKDKTLIEKAYP